MNCQGLFFIAKNNNKKKIINLWSAEFAQYVLSIKSLHVEGEFLDGFLKNPSFKIAMSGRVRRHRVSSRFTFWLTFFQSYMLPLFFNVLLSYLVGMKRRTVDVSHARETTPTFFLI